MSGRLQMTINALGLIESVSAFSLKSDMWEDYEFLIKKAKKHNSNGNIRKTNTYLRSALLALFAHIEAVVNDILKNQKATREQRTKLPLHKKCELVSKLSSVECPNLEDLKVARNYISHPGGNKDDSYPFKHITLENIISFENSIIEWLNLCCENTKTERFVDTKHMVERFSKKIGNTSSINSI